MSQNVDPLAVLLRSVRVVGTDFCWPALDVLDVLDAFAQLGRVVLGAELWRFDEGLAPTVVGWTQYEVPDGAALERVAWAHRRAADELFGHAGDRSAFVNLTWEQAEVGDA